MDSPRKLKRVSQRKRVIEMPTKPLAQSDLEAQFRKALQSSEPIILTAEEGLRVLQTLAHPPAPNLALRKAAAQYVESVEHHSS